MKNTTNFKFCLLLISSIFSSTLAQAPIDPFSTPNVVYTEYTGYGGGNVNQDEEDIINWDDYNAMDTMPSHISDIDGDGIPSTDHDKQILEDYLNGNKAYLPGHWSRLQTRQEREDWARKIANIYNVDDKVWDDNADPLLWYISGHFKTDIVIATVGHDIEGVDYFGFPKVSIFDKYNNKGNNGKGNLPFMGVQRIRGPPYRGHGMNAILVGDEEGNYNPLEFDNWLWYEPQNNKFVDIRKDEGTGEFAYNQINIEFFHDLYNVGEGVNETQMEAYPVPVQFFIEKDTGIDSLGWVDPMTVLIRPIVAIENEKGSIPKGYSLEQNYPNPFNPSTTIQFTVETGHALSLQLNVYDINGKEIVTLIDNIITNGSYTVEWNASGYPSGIYFYQLQGNYGVIATRKMLLMK